LVKKVIIKKKKGSILTIKENYKRKEKTMKVIDKIALVLIIIGAINWGLIGIFEFDLVAAIFGQMSMVSRIIYSLVGISGLWGIKLLFDRD
jgi:uncharacterized membrane protein YuzA (DUF378 family)